MGKKSKNFTEQNNSFFCRTRSQCSIFLGELHQFFEFLYDNDVVSEEALFAWEKCENPAEAEGKGVAITSTTQFFSWLRLAEDEEEEDDEVAT